MEITKKIGFVHKTIDDEYITEWLWCYMENDYFVIDNIPFIARNISLGDIIKVEYDLNDEGYYFDELIKVSGNSTVRILYYADVNIDNIRDHLKSYNCDSEVFKAHNIIAVNIPSDVNYLPVKHLLDKGEDDGKWTYEESCLEHEY